MNFVISSREAVSRAFAEMGISDFAGACSYISRIPYRRNVDKKNILCVFNDNGGTCSTKHAVLRKLALENGQTSVSLMLGIFRMDPEYAPKIAKTLSSSGLEYIPEAHNYLKIGGDYFDFTRTNSKYSDFAAKLLWEKEIEYDQVTDEKIEIHKKFLTDWIAGQPDFTPERIWKIREQCIKDLQS